MKERITNSVLKLKLCNENSKFRTDLTKKKYRVGRRGKSKSEVEEVAENLERVNDVWEHKKGGVGAEEQVPELLDLAIHTFLSHFHLSSLFFLTSLPLSLLSPLLSIPSLSEPWNLFHISLPCLFIAKKKAFGTWQLAQASQDLHLK